MFKVKVTNSHYGNQTSTYIVVVILVNLQILILALFGHLTDAMSECYVVLIYETNMSRLESRTVIL